MPRIVELTQPERELNAIAERADDEACRKAGIPLYWCEAIRRYVTVPAKED